MTIWDDLYKAAKDLYHPREASDFIYTNHVVAAIEDEDGQIFTGFCMEATSGVFHLCAERAALFNMYQATGQLTVKRILAFRDKPPYGGGSGMPCGACREFLAQCSSANKATEIMVDFASRETITLGELLPYWWGEERQTIWENMHKETSNGRLSNKD